MDAASYEHGYGGFLLGDMALALPMAALREVVPCSVLSLLPCDASSVIGAIDLRGVAVPVVDLRVALGLADAQGPQPNVIIMLHQNRLLGLLAGPVTGVFSAPPEALKRASVAHGVVAVLAGSLRRDDLGELVSVLSPEAVACLPGVPMIDDPEPARQHLASDDATVEVVDHRVQMLLLRCGQVPFAIDAVSVYATVSHSTLRPSPLARGACKGVIEYAGVEVPMLDLLACCGLGELDPTQPMQGFLLRQPTGLVGLLVAQVMDVLSIDMAEVVALPPHVLPRGDLVTGTLSLQPPRVAEITAGQYLVLDGVALAAEETLRNLARASQPGAAQAHAVATQAVVQNLGRSMVIYEVLGESATPLEQITEILPYDPARAIFHGMGPLLGVVTHRGRSVPIYCLRRLLGAESLDCTPTTTMLLVEDAGHTAAFVVQQLRDIAPAAWEPSLPMHRGGSGTARPLARPLVQVGQDEHQRMLPLLDLVQHMRDLRAQRRAA